MPLHIYFFTFTLPSLLCLILLLRVIGYGRYNRIAPQNTPSQKIHKMRYELEMTKRNEKILPDYKSILLEAQHQTNMYLLLLLLLFLLLLLLLIFLLLLPLLLLLILLLLLLLLLSEALIDDVLNSRTLSSKYLTVTVTVATNQ